MHWRLKTKRSLFKTHRSMIAHTHIHPKSTPCHTHTLTYHTRNYSSVKHTASLCCFEFLYCDCCRVSTTCLCSVHCYTLSFSIFGVTWWGAGRAVAVAFCITPNGTTTNSNKSILNRNTCSTTHTKQENIYRSSLKT